MSTTLIVLAHPEADSFNGDWARASADGARAAGQDVLWSDLYADGFDPVERYGANDDLAAEIEKLLAADQIVFHFPLWWYGPPAILKGWLDRMLGASGLYDEAATFGAGPGRGKRALFCVTAGVSAEECGPSGRSGDARLQLWPMAHALRCCGIDVLEPYIMPGVRPRTRPAMQILLEGQLARVLADQPTRMAAFERLPVWASNPDSDFTDDDRLRSGAPVFSPFIRHDDGM